MPAEVGGAERGGDLDRLLEGFDRFSGSLVRLEPYRLEEVRRWVEAFARAVVAHLDERAGASSPGRAAHEGPGALLGRLNAEHARFRSSVEQLRGLLAVVEGDDHGGHRQALGQYGRIFAEALRSHRADERALTRPDDPRGGLPRSRPRARQP